MINKKWLIIGCIILAVVIIVVCAVLYFMSTPEYALLQIRNDVKESGIDGLQPHLTGDAAKIVSAIAKIDDYKLLISIIGGLLVDQKYVSVLKSELQVIQWELRDILKDGNNASVIVGFNYDDKLSGAITMTMVRENRQWKISGLKFPKLD